MKKKILFFMPSFEGGGVEKNLILVANFFAKKPIELKLITASKKYKKNFNNKINFISPNSHIWDKLGRIPKYFISLYLLFLEYLKDKNFIVFCFQGNIFCILFCKFFKIKIVIRPNSSPAGWSKNTIKKKIFSKVFNLADKIIVNSYDFKKELKKKFNINSTTIYNPLNSKDIIKLSKYKIKKTYFNKNSLKIISVGRLVDQKDHMTLLKAINEIKNKIRISLLIIGEGKNKKIIKEFISNNNLEKSVKLKDYTKNPFPYIKQADVFILTSKFEGLPNVLLEAITLKKFVISTDCPTGPNEILDGGKGGLLFKVGDFLDLGKKIQFFKNNYKLCKKKNYYAQKQLFKYDSSNNLNKYYKNIVEILNN